MVPWELINYSSLRCSQVRRDTQTSCMILLRISSTHGAPPWGPGSTPTGSACSNSGGSCPTRVPCACGNLNSEEPFASHGPWHPLGQLPCTNSPCADNSRSRRSFERLRSGGKESSGIGTILPSFWLTHGVMGPLSLCLNASNMPLRNIGNGSLAALSTPDGLSDGAFLSRPPPCSLSRLLPVGPPRALNTPASSRSFSVVVPTDGPLALPLSSGV